MDMRWTNESAALYVGRRLLQALSEEEAMAVVAYEYGHLVGHHSRFGGFIYRFRIALGPCRIYRSSRTTGART